MSKIQPYGMLDRGGPIDMPTATKKTRKPATDAAAPAPKPAPPVVPILTRPVGVAAGKGTPKAEVRGHEEAIDRIIEIRQEVENLQTEEKLLRGPVEAAGKHARETLERQTGKTIKSVVVHGTEDRSARLTWRNAYMPVDVGHESALRACLGTHFDSLFTITKKLKLKENSGTELVDELRAALGDRFDVLFSVTDEICAKEELMEKRTAIAPSLSADQNTALDLVLEQLQASPSLNTK